MNVNSDETYTVELEENEHRLDDVPKDYVKDWAVATADLRPGVADKGTKNKFDRLICSKCNYSCYYFIQLLLYFLLFFTTLVMFDIMTFIYAYT